MRHIEVDDVQFEIVEADGSAVAEKLLNEQEFDIVFTDIRMPGMDGLTLIDIWRTRLSQTQWVVLSGYDDFSYAQKAITLGVMDYLLKPVSKKSARRTLERLLENHKKQTNNFISLNELNEYLQKLEGAIWTLDVDSMKSIISSMCDTFRTKEIEISYLQNTLNNLYFNLVQRINDRGSVFIDAKDSSVNGKNKESSIESFQEQCIILIEQIRTQRKGQFLDPIEYAKEYITDNLNHKISLENVANRLGLSPSYFSHLFKKETGTSFVEFRKRLLMEKAMKLMENGSLKITEVANSLGYEDLPHFTRTFKKYTGLSPSQYISTLEIK